MLNYIKIVSAPIVPLINLFLLLSLLYCFILFFNIICINLLHNFVLICIDLSLSVYLFIGPYKPDLNK